MTHSESRERKRKIIEDILTGESDENLANRYGIGCKYVQQLRSENTEIRKEIPDKFNWASVDWNLNDAAIAKELDCSRERVRQQRKNLNKNRSPDYRKQSSKGSRDEKILIYLRNGKSIKEIAEEFNLSGQRIRDIGIKNEIKLPKKDRTLFRMDLVDWSLSDKQITDQLELSYPTVYYARLKFTNKDIPKEYLNVNWNLSNKVISKQLKRHVGTVRTFRDIMEYRNNDKSKS